MTKQPELGFPTPEDIAALKVWPELIEVYRVHYERSAKRRGTSLYIHDLGLVMLTEQHLGAIGGYPYKWESVRIIEAPYLAPLAGQPERRGTIVIEPAESSSHKVVVWQDTNRYRDRVATYLQS